LKTKKFFGKRVLSLLLTLLMVLSLVPVSLINTSAANETDDVYGFKVEINAHTATTKDTTFSDTTGNTSAIYDLVVTQNSSTSFTFTYRLAMARDKYNTFWLDNETVTINDFSCDTDYYAKIDCSGTRADGSYSSIKYTYYLEISRNEGHKFGKWEPNYIYENLDNFCKRDCAICGYTEYMGHNYAEATCEKGRHCTRCGVTVSEPVPTAHTFGAWSPNGDGTHTRTCKFNSEHTETLSCSYSAATCTASAKCTDCGHTKGDPDSENHTSEEFKYVQGENGVHNKYHACCNAFIKTEDCTYSTATCTDSQKCVHCGYENGVIDKDNHTSTEIKYEQGENGVHNKYHACCNAFIETENCSYSTATCMAAAKCTYCGYINGEPDSDNHTSTKFKYEQNSADVHNKYHACCNALFGTGEHTYDKNSKCTLCSYQCEHPSFTDGYCDKCNYRCTHPVTDGDTCLICNESLEIPELVNGVYEIFTEKQLIWFADFVNAGNTSANAILMNDIVVNEGEMTANTDSKSVYHWSPIGNNDNRYAGTFDGNGKTVSGLYFNDTTTNYVGLFGDINKGGVVKNTGVINSYFKGYKYVGGVAGFCSGTITNCYNTGSVTGVYYVGGVVGRNSGTTTNCYNTGRVDGHTSVGGVCGIITSSTSAVLANCYNTGNVILGFSYGGGVVGESTAGATITNCYYLNTAFKGGIYGKDVAGSAEAKTAEQFKGGEVAYLLQGTQSEEIWGQKLGTDTYPVIGGDKVYYGYITCDKADDTIGYTNLVSSETVKPEHTWSGDCDNTCNICAQKRTDTAEHTYSSDCDEICNICDEVRTTDVLHNFENGTCTACDMLCGHNFDKGFCTVCGEPCQHKWEDGVCTICSEACEHNFDNGFCTVCGDFEPATLNEDSVYEIANAGQLYWFAEFVNAGNANANAILTDDIIVNTGDVAGCGGVKDESWLSWTPIGNNLNFKGIFDGNDHYISGLYHNESTTYNFGLVGNNFGTIKNVTVKNSYLSVKERVGAICGWNEGLIENCANIGSYCKGDLCVGGIAAMTSNGTIRNCYNSGTIDCATYRAGGITGVIQKVSVMENCFSCGIVYNVENSNVGALAGLITNTNTTVAEVTNCYYDKDVCDDDAFGFNGGANATETISSVEGKTSAQCASGEVAYLLQGTQAEEIWGQKIGTDTYPVFGGDKVYYGYTSCAYDSEMVYTNTEVSDVRPAHKELRAEFTWDGPYDGECYVSVELYCTECGGYADFGSGYATLKETVEAEDCMHQGSELYEVTFEYEGVTYTDTKSFALKSDNHTGELVNGFCTTCGGYQKPEVDLGEDPEWDYDDVYLISNAGQLYWYAQKLNEEDVELHAMLINDITVPEDAPNWTPINCSYAYFDGNFKTISGLKCVDTEATYVGLFGNEGWWYEITNLHITNSYFEGNDSVGAVVASLGNGGFVKNCYVTNTIVKGDSYRVGTLVGYLGSGNIINCYVDTDTLAGYYNSSYGTIENSYYLSDTDDGNGGKTAEQFESGEVAYLLQGQQTENIWGQKIGEDTYPVFGGDKVYAVTNCKDEVVGYSNTNESGKHNVVDGACANCGLSSTILSEIELLKRAIAHTNEKADENNVLESKKEPLNFIYQELLAIGKREESGQVSSLELVKISLSSYMDQLENGIADGTWIKADYTEIDAAVAEIESGGATTDKVSAKLEEIKSEISVMKESSETSKADVAVLMKEVEALKDCVSGNHIFENGFCTICGEEEPVDKLAGYTISLGDKIAVNYYMSLTEKTVNDANAKMVFTVPDTASTYTVEIPVSSVTPNADGYYVFTCEVAAKDMTSVIKAQFITSDKELALDDYSVQEYAEVILSDTVKYEKEQELVKAMLNYGAQAQIYFGYNTDNLANDTDYMNEEEKVTELYGFAGAPFTLEGEEAGVTYYGTSLVLETEVAFKHYFIIDEGIDVDSLEITCDYPVTLKKSGNLYVLKISNIPANQIGKSSMVVSIGGITLDYTIYSYGALAQSAGKTELWTVLSALAHYANAASLYAK